jgi:hypothetical protein
MNPTQQRALRLLMEAELSHNEIHDALRKALRALHSRAWCWLQEIYDNHVVYEVNPKPDPAMPDEANVQAEGPRLFDVDYSVDEAGSVTLGVPREVRKVVTYEPVVQVAAATEAAGDDLELDFVPLVEKAVRKDGTMPVKIIQPGWGSSGYYSQEVLMRDGPKVFTKGLKMFADHPTPTEEAERPERSIKDLVATLSSDARWDPVGPSIPTAEGRKPAGPGLYADALVVDSWKPVVEELAPQIGVSIRAFGKAVRGEAEGKQGAIIEGITAARSVDLVTAPGAGGKILSLFESARSRAQETITMGGEGDVDDKELQEAKAAREAAEAKLAESATENETLKAENARLKEAEILREARVFVGKELPADMADITRARLLETLSKNPPVVDGALDEAAYKTAIESAVKAEVEYLAGITESGAIRGMGSRPAPSATDKAALAEQWKAKYLADGHDEATATKLAEIAAGR